MIGESHSPSSLACSSAGQSQILSTSCLQLLLCVCEHGSSQCAWVLSLEESRLLEVWTQG